MDEKGAVVVLQVIGEMVMGGAESRIMDIMRHIDRNKIRYDFLVFNPERQHYDEEIESLGGRIYRFSPRYRIYNTLAYRRGLRYFFKAHPEIDIVQGHMTSSAAIYLPIAKECGIPCTMAHARSAGVDPGLKGRLTKWLRRDLYHKADICLACSSDAGRAVYGEKAMAEGGVQVLVDANDLSAYIPTKEARERALALRKKYGLEGRRVLGHVGRFHYAKNHEFLLEIFRRLLKKDPESGLLLVGDGERMEFVRRKAEELGIAGQVIFAGMQKDPVDFYHMMDILVMPSRYEGLPGTVVEAQAAGVPCLISDVITRDMAVTELVHYKALEEGPLAWAKEIWHILQRGEKQKALADDNRENQKKLADAGFDVAAQAKMLEGIYARLAKGGTWNG